MDYNITGRQNDPPKSGRIGWHLKMLQISFQNSFTCFFDQAMSICIFNTGNVSSFCLIYCLIQPWCKNQSQMTDRWYSTRESKKVQFKEAVPEGLH